MKTDKYKKIFFLVVVPVIVFSIIVVLYFKFRLDIHIPDTKFFSLILAFSAFFGVFNIVFEKKHSRDLEEAKFIFDLARNLDDRYREVEKILRNKEKKGLTDDEVISVLRYFDYFEPFNILLEKEIISLCVIDELFFYRFFKVVNNPKIQSCVIFEYGKFLGNIINLYKRWKAYRLKVKKDETILLSYTDVDLISAINENVEKKCQEKMTCGSKEE